MIIESTGRIHPHLINFIDSVLSEKAQGDPVLKGKLRKGIGTLIYLVQFKEPW